MWKGFKTTGNRSMCWFFLILADRAFLYDDMHSWTGIRSTRWHSKQATTSNKHKLYENKTPLENIQKPAFLTQWTLFIIPIDHATVIALHLNTIHSPERKRNPAIFFNYSVGVNLLSDNLWGTLLMRRINKDRESRGLMYRYSVRSHVGAE